MEHIRHLSRDKKLEKIIRIQQPFELVKRKNVCLHLCTCILSQQLSIKVADVFEKRFFALFESRQPGPKEILEVPFETLRGIGLSNAKANYIHNICRFFIEEKITDKKLDQMTNEELITYLSQIKGVGQWTVEMILMFTMGREDVFALDDFGIQQTIIKLYKLNPANKKELREKMIFISKGWSPYRTYACRYLWGWKDTK